jgi:hypothetical protein
MQKNFDPMLAYCFGSTPPRIERRDGRQAGQLTGNRKTGFDARP